MAETTEMCIRCEGEAIEVASFCGKCIDDLEDDLVLEMEEYEL